MNEQDYNNAESVEFICMDNMDLQTAISETLTMFSDSDEYEIKQLFADHLKRLVDIQHERASLRAVTERKK